MERLDERNGLLDRHAVAQYARNEFGVVPELFVEQTRDAADGIRITVTVGILEVVTLGAVVLADLDDEALVDLAGNTWRPPRSYP